MNYGKIQSTRKANELRKPMPKLARWLKVLIYKLIAVAVLTLAVVGVFGGYGAYRGIIDSSPEIDAMDVTPTGFLTTVLDKNGNTTATLVASGSNRVYVTIDEIPDDLEHAFVAIEDERFYEHNGIDVTGIIRAGVTGIMSGSFSQGASTITQQLLKNAVFDTWTTDKGFAKVVRKLQEQYLATELEKRVSKEWILENYMNTVNLGQNCLGVQSAARRYFGKDVSELTLSECAVIAGITQNPSGLNPISHPESNATRREKILGNMLKYEYITQEQYDEAMADDVYERIQVVNVAITEDPSSQITSYYVDELTDQVIADLEEQLGYTRTEAYKALYNGGLTIYSCQDPDLQKICDEEVARESNYPVAAKVSFSYALTIEDKDGNYHNYDDQTMLYYYLKQNSRYTLVFNTKEEARAAVKQYKKEMKGKKGKVIAERLTFTMQPQVALTLMDQSTGEVLAQVGGRGKKVASRTLNRASDSTRQPGSCFKVLAAYAGALDEAGMTLATTQNDAHYTYKNGTPLRNYDNRYRGWTSIREGIQDSINVVAVKTLDDLGIENGYTYLENFGFTTLTSSDKVQALALGGLTRGVTNLELTAAYASIANYGTYIKPRYYTKILDHDGNVLIDNTPQSRTVLKETTAWLLTDAMKDVITKGTSTVCKFDGMAICGKSGTTSKNKDALFAGYSPYYTCVVWGGFDDGSVQTTGTWYVKVIWREIMKRAHEGMEYTDFEQPEGIVECTICTTSGQLPIPGVCGTTKTEYFAVGTEPEGYCKRHGGGYTKPEDLLVNDGNTTHIILNPSDNTPQEEEKPNNNEIDGSLDGGSNNHGNGLSLDINGDLNGHDSHRGLEGADQVIIYGDEISN